MLQSKRPVVPSLEVELVDEGHKRVVELITGGDGLRVGRGFVNSVPPPLFLPRALCVRPSKRQVVVPNLEVQLMDEGHQRVVELITGGDLVQRASLGGLAGYDATRSTLT